MIFQFFFLYQKQNKQKLKINKQKHIKQSKAEQCKTASAQYRSFIVK